MLTSFNGVGFYSYMVHGVWRYLKNVDEVLVHVFYLSTLSESDCHITLSITIIFLSMLQMTYDYFRANDEIAMTTKERIVQSLKALQNENDYIIFEDGTICHNEQELLNVLEEKGGIL